MTFTLLKKTSNGIFFGWHIVAATFVLAMFGWGIGFYGAPVLLHAVRETRGWSLKLVSAAITTHFLFGALVVANLPKIHRRFGVPLVAKAGSISLALGIIGWAAAFEPWQIFVAALLSGAGWVSIAAVTVNAIIAPWFVRARPAALATAYNGASIGGVVFSPLLILLISIFGFTLAAVMVGLLMVVTIWILSDKYFALDPVKMGLTPDGDAPDAVATPVTSSKTKSLPGKLVWKNRQFQTLAAGMAISLFVQSGLVAHLLSLLVPALGSLIAGLAMSLATLSAICGRMVVGWFMPVGADRRLAACTNLCVQIAGSLTLFAAQGSNIPLLLLGVILFGIGIGNATSLPPLIAQVEFVKADVMRIIALIVALSQFTWAFSPLVFGVLRVSFADELGNESFLFLVAAAMQVIAIIIFLFGRQGKTI
jgi:Major Facilitator Superfamily